MVGKKKFVPNRHPELLPAARILGLRCDDELKMAERIDRGFSPAVVGRLARKLDMTEAKVLAVSAIPKSTYHARKRRRQRLSATESSRIYRIAQAVAAATAYFEGSESAAVDWLTKAKAALGGKVPLEFARTPEGSAYVIKVLGRMEHGIIG